MSCRFTQIELLTITCCLNVLLRKVHTFDTHTWRETDLLWLRRVSFFICVLILCGYSAKPLNLVSNCAQYHWTEKMIVEWPTANDSTSIDQIHTDKCEMSEEKKKRQKNQRNKQPITSYQCVSVQWFLSQFGECFEQMHCVVANSVLLFYWCNDYSPVVLQWMNIGKLQGKSETGRQFSSFCFCFLFAFNIGKSHSVRIDALKYQIDYVHCFVVQPNTALKCDLLHWKEWKDNKSTQWLWSMEG